LTYSAFKEEGNKTHVNLTANYRTHPSLLDITSKLFYGISPQCIIYPPATFTDMNFVITK